MDCAMNPIFTFAPAVLEGGLQEQFEAFLDDHRQMLYDCLDEVTEAQAHQRDVESRTTLLGLVKHATFVERVWFGEIIQGKSRDQLKISATPEGSFELDESDTIGTVREAHVAACQESRRVAASLEPDDIVATPLGPLPMRWVYLHLLREFAQHCGHADILRERILGSTLS